mmetsp:Transcript_33305/g.91144  ORF Transcript_33305/g.91144 Transcript_33305/m.91144 type:complete len:87 (+) Transcript_33305:72-332(+)
MHPSLDPTISFYHATRKSSSAPHAVTTYTYALRLSGKSWNPLLWGDHHHFLQRFNLIHHLLCWVACIAASFAKYDSLHTLSIGEQL